MLALTVHNGLAMLVAALAVVAIWWQLGRRILLYVLTLHILVGIWVIVAEHSATPQHFGAPPLHYAFALLGWAGYMVSNAVAKRGREKAALGLAIASSVFVLVAFSIGQWATKAVTT
jgi:cytochrome bd-type quinol oxidase subunit 2